MVLGLRSVLGGDQNQGGRDDGGRDQRNGSARMSDHGMGPPEMRRRVVLSVPPYPERRPAAIPSVFAIVAAVLTGRIVNVARDSPVVEEVASGTGKRKSAKVEAMRDTRRVDTQKRTSEGSDARYRVKGGGLSHGRSRFDAEEGFRPRRKRHLAVVGVAPRDPRRPSQATKKAALPVPESRFRRRWWARRRASAA